MKRKHFTLLNNLEKAYSHAKQIDYCFLITTCGRFNLKELDVLLTQLLNHEPTIEQFGVTISVHLV